MQNGLLLAAVDLGSNSYRLEIGRHDHGQIHRTEYIKETVRQGNGLDEDRNLTPEAMQRGWDCLARFGERLAGFKRAQVRAVATQTLREARNRDEFLGKARQVLGFPIDVISGREEARLIYQGVAHLLPQSDERRLVMDIGGTVHRTDPGPPVRRRRDRELSRRQRCLVDEVFPAGPVHRAGFRIRRNCRQGSARRGPQHLPAAASGTWPTARPARSAPLATCWALPAGHAGTIDARRPGLAASAPCSTRAARIGYACLA